MVVRRLDAFFCHECPERIVDLEESVAETLCFFVRPVAPSLERPQKPEFHQIHARFQGRAVQASGLKFVPESEDFFDRPSARLCR